MRKYIKYVSIALLLFSITTLTDINAKAFTTCNSVTITKDTDNNGNTTYTNRANGRTYTVNADGTTSGDKNEYKYRSTEVVSSENVEVGRYKEITVTLPYGQSSISNLKVKKGEKLISAKISSKEETKGLKLNSVKDKNGDYYYLDRVTGERIYTGGKPYIYVDFANYKIRVYGKKTGKAVLQFQINDSNGNKVGTKKIKINVSNNGNAITSATFAGKSLLYNYSNKGNNKKNLYYNGSDDGAESINKKSGKLKIKLNKNYRLSAIYLRKNNEYETKTYEENSVFTGTYTEKKLTAVDLNGDGDCNDIIDGIEESSSSDCYYERIKNGQKIKLSNVPTVYDKVNQTWKNSGENTIVDYKSYQAITEIIVIYQDKRTGAYYNWKKNIIRAIK